jgi:acyl-CoA reductase-like NAD-dependent aldehyde dehydrogenase
MPIFVTHGADMYAIIAMNPKSTMGTIISLRHLQRIESMIGRTTGKVIIGGERMTGKSELDNFDFSKGCFFAPTIVSDISTDDELWKEEVFGPVVVIRRFFVGLFVELLPSPNEFFSPRTSKKVSC